MSGTIIPEDWENPIHVSVGMRQLDVSPNELLSSRVDLWRTRLHQQIQLLQAGIERWTPILVNTEGVIIDGHHAVRAASDLGIDVDVLVQQMSVRPIGLSIQELEIH